MYWRIKRADCQRGYGDGNKSALKAEVDAGLVPASLDTSRVGQWRGAPSRLAIASPSSTARRLSGAWTTNRYGRSPASSSPGACAGGNHRGAAESGPGFRGRERRSRCGGLSASDRDNQAPAVRALHGIARRSSGLASTGRSAIGSAARHEVFADRSAVVTYRSGSFGLKVVLAICSSRRGTARPLLAASSETSPRRHGAFVDHASAHARESRGVVTTRTPTAATSW